MRGEGAGQVCGGCHVAPSRFARSAARPCHAAAPLGLIMRLVLNITHLQGVAVWRRMRAVVCVQTGIVTFLHFFSMP